MATSSLKEDVAKYVTDTDGKLCVSSVNETLGAKGLESIIDVLIHLQKKKAASLSSLSLNNDDLNNSGAERVARYLGETEVTLDMLSLACNNIWHAGASQLATLLTSSAQCSIIELNMDNNHLGDDGVIALAGALKENNTLTAISVDQNAITNVGCEALAGALTFNSTLVRLSLKANKIGDDGAIALANMLGGLGLPLSDMEALEEAAPVEAPETGKKTGKKKPAKAEQKSEEEMEAERVEKEAKELKRKQTEERLAMASRKNEALVELSMQNNTAITIIGMKAISEGVSKHDNLLRLEVDTLEEVLFRGATETSDRITASLSLHQRMRLAVVQQAFCMGFHKRVGCRSGIRYLLGEKEEIKPAVLDSVWGFLGHV